MGWKVKDARKGDVVYAMDGKGVAESDGHRNGYYWYVNVAFDKCATIFGCSIDSFTESDIRKNAFFRKHPSGQDRLSLKMRKLTNSRFLKMRKL